MPLPNEVALEGGLDGGGEHMQILDEQLIMLALFRFQEQLSKFPISCGGFCLFLSGVEALEDE